MPAIVDDTALKAARAVKTFRSMNPTLTSYARALSGRKDVTVVLDARSNGATDGTKIFYSPPISLGDNSPHESRKCNRRGENKQQQCAACAIREEVLATIYHEIAHICFESFVSNKTWIDNRDEAFAFIKSTEGDYADKIWERVQQNRYSVTTFVQLAHLVNPYMAFLWNALEDARVNQALFRARNGTRGMMEASDIKTFTQGVQQQVDAVTGEAKVLKWSEYPLNSQVMVGLYCMACEYDFTDWFAPEVVAALNDTKLRMLVNRLDSTRTVEAVWSLSFPVLVRLRELGFCLDERDPQPDPEPEPEPEEQDESVFENDTSKSNPQSEGETSEDDSEESGDEQEGTDGGEDSPGVGSDSGDGDEPGWELEDDAPPAEDASHGDDEDASPDDGEAGDSGGEGDAAGPAGDAGKPDGAGEAGKSVPDESGDEEDGEPTGGGTDAPADDLESDSDPDGEDADASADAECDSEVGGSDSAEETDEASDDESEGEADKAVTDHGEWKSADYGTVEENQQALKFWAGHEEQHTHDDSEHSGETEAMKIAIQQGHYFDTSSANVLGVNEVRYSDPQSEYSAWVDFQDRGNTGKPIIISESILGPALQQMRVAFSENQRSKQERNLKSGKVRPGVLGKRAHFGDERLFQKKHIAGKRNYAVEIGMDISGSTAGENIELMREAVTAQAELCKRMGVEFSIMAHSTKVSHEDGMMMEVYHIKEAFEPWSDSTRQRLAEINAHSGNLDGHALEYLRKKCDRSSATDKIILYYSDGAMPASNRREELEILQREIANCKRLGYTLLGVGINTSSPEKHGLPTARVDSHEDVSKVVKHLQKFLLAR
jgi:hypothetical protein